MLTVRCHEDVRSKKKKRIKELFLFKTDSSLGRK